MFLPLQMGTNYQGGTDFLRLAKPRVAGLTKQLKSYKKRKGNTNFHEKNISVYL